MNYKSGTVGKVWVKDYGQLSLHGKHGAAAIAAANTCAGDKVSE